jgi:hypothetical protein
MSPAPRVTAASRPRCIANPSEARNGGAGVMVQSMTDCDEVLSPISGPLVSLHAIGQGRPVSTVVGCGGQLGRFDGAAWRDSRQSVNWNTVFRPSTLGRPVPGRRCSSASRPAPKRLAISTGSRQSTPRLSASTSTGRPFHASQGVPSNYMKLGLEPPDHAIGRSRGGLTSKLHVATEGKGRMLSAVLTAGNINDTTMMAATLEQRQSPQNGTGRPTADPIRDRAPCRNADDPSRRYTGWNGRPNPRFRRPRISAEHHPTRLTDTGTVQLLRGRPPGLDMQSTNGPPIRRQRRISQDSRHSAGPSNEI